MSQRQSQGPTSSKKCNATFLSSLIILEKSLEADYGLPADYTYLKYNLFSEMANLVLICDGMHDIFHMIMSK